MTERVLFDKHGVKVYKRHFDFSAEVGHADHIAVDAGRIHLNFERSVGVYGFRDTVSYATRIYRDAK